jgi:hypothetical protein
MSDNSKLTITCLDFKRIDRDTLRGVCKIKLRLEISDIAVHEKDGKFWVGPGKPQIIRDGVLFKNGEAEIQHTPLMAFTDGNTANAFTQRVIEAIRRSFPHAFEREEGER